MGETGEDEIGDNFLSSWKPGKLNPGAVDLELGDSPPRKTGNKFSLPSFDMDLDIDGGFGNLPTFNLDLSGFDSPPKRGAKSTTTAQKPYLNLSGFDSPPKRAAKPETTQKPDLDISGFESPPRRVAEPETMEGTEATQQEEPPRSPVSKQQPTVTEVLPPSSVLSKGTETSQQDEPLPLPVVKQQATTHLATKQVGQFAAATPSSVISPLTKETTRKQKLTQEEDSASRASKTRLLSSPLTSPTRQYKNAESLKTRFRLLPVPPKEITRIPSSAEKLRGKLKAGQGAILKEKGKLVSKTEVKAMEELHEEQTEKEPHSSPLHLSELPAVDTGRGNMPLPLPDSSQTPQKTREDHGDLVLDAQNSKTEDKPMEEQRDEFHGKEDSNLQDSSSKQLVVMDTKVENQYVASRNDNVAMDVDELGVNSDRFNDIIAKADKCSKDLEEMCKSLRRSQDEAKDLLVKVLVANNTLLMHRPVLNEKFELHKRSVEELFSRITMSPSEPSSIPLRAPTEVPEASTCTV